MRNVYDIVDLRVTTLAVRQLAFPENRLEAYLPNVESEEVEYRLEATDRFNRAAGVRAFGTPTPIIARPGVVETRGGLPALGALLPVTESERIRARRLAGTPLAEVYGPDAQRLAAFTAAAVQNKAELLRGQAISTGMVVINENGVDQVADFGIAAANKVVAPVAWTDTANADILNDLFTWHDVYVSSAGGAAGVMLTSRRVIGLMLRNAAARASFTPAPNLVTPGQLAALLEAHGLPPVVSYDRQIEDATGALQRVIAENRIVFLPGDGNTVGRTQFGLTEEALTLVGQRILAPDEAPGMVTITLQEDEPVSTAVKTAAIGLPVIDNPRALVTGTVF